MVNVIVYTTPNKSNDKKIKYINKDLPKPIDGKTIRWLLISSSGGGKSNFIKNILFNKDWGYNRYYDEIYLWSGSIDDMKEYKELSKHYEMDDKIAITQKYNEAEMKDLFNDIEKTSTRKEPPRVLFILDDQVCNDISSRGKTNLLDELFIRGRHLNISIILSCQKYRLLNQNIRVLNLTHLTMFSNTNSIDRKAIADEHSSKYKPEEILELMNKQLTSRYSYITIDYLNHDVDERFLNQDFKPIKIQE